MEFTLNIYNSDKEIEKTYRTNDFMLMTGTAEDIIGIIELDKFKGGFDDKEALLEVMKIVVKLFPLFNPVMKDIFVGLTDEEYKRTNVFEVGRLVFNVVTYTFSQLMSAAPTETKKN